jgi:hypothetical protein
VEEFGDRPAPDVFTVPAGLPERAPVDHPRIPGARQEPATPARGTASGGPVPRPFPAMPAAMTPPPVGPALPHPRGDEPASPAPHVSRPATPSPEARGRGLRRRVPQSHLAPELRHLGSAGLADTAAPLAADAAATALSRYQASRLAAQAVVDAPGGSRQTEGERE